MNALFFWLFGASDATARLVPALAGVALPLSMLLFNRILGRRAALVAAGILALSPSLTFLSRNASGVMLAAAASLVFLGAIWRSGRTDSADSRWALLAGLAVGLGIAANGSFLGMVLALLLSSLVSGSSRLVDAWKQLGRRGPFLMAIGSMMAVSTMFFFHPDGAGIVGDSLMQWLSNFRIGWAGRSLGILVVYELFPLLFGLAGVATYRWRSSVITRVFSVLALIGLLLLLLRPDQADAIALLIIPLAVLAGVFVDDVLNNWRLGRTRLLNWGPVAAVAILGTHISISLGQYSHYLPTNPDRATASLLLAAVSLILLIGLVLLVWTYNWPAALGGLVLGMFVLLSVFSWGRAWQLGHEHQADPRELWVQEASAPGARILVDTLRTASHRATGSYYSIPLTVQSSDPVLQWYLRDFEDVTWVDGLWAEIVSDAVVAPYLLESPLLGDNYLGMDLALRLVSPANVDRSTMDNLRWFILRDRSAAGDPLATFQAVIWLRQDLALVSGE